jgi:hypothetical protein
MRNCFTTLASNCPFTFAISSSLHVTQLFACVRKRERSRRQTSGIFSLLPSSSSFSPWTTKHLSAKEGFGRPILEASLGLPGECTQWQYSNSAQSNEVRGCVWAWGKTKGVAKFFFFVFFAFLQPSPLSSNDVYAKRLTSSTKKTG